MTTIPPTMYCINHPTTETTLRCNRCENPICSKCAISTPTGYRCPDCVRGQQKTFNTTEWYDYPVSFILAVVLSFLGSQLVRFLGFFTIILAPFAGVVIAEVVRKAVSKRRSKYLYLLVALGAVSGGIIPVVIYLVPVFMVLMQGSFANLGFLLPILWQSIYAFIVTTTCYYRLSGIQI